MTGTVRLLLGREVASHWNDLGCYEYVRISKPLQALLNMFNIFILYSLDFSRIWCWTGLKWNGGVHLLSLQSFIICKDGILDAKGCCAKCLPQNGHDQRRSTKTEAPRSCSSSWSCFVDWIRCITAECHREQGDNEEFLPWFRVKLQQIQENQRRISQSSFLQFHIFTWFHQKNQVPVVRLCIWQDLTSDVLGNCQVCRAHSSSLSYGKSYGNTDLEKSVEPLEPV